MPPPDVKIKVSSGTGCRVASFPLIMAAAVNIGETGHINIGRIRCRLNLLRRRLLTCYRSWKRGHRAAAWENQGDGEVVLPLLQDGLFSHGLWQERRKEEYSRRRRRYSRPKAAEAEVVLIISVRVTVELVSSVAQDRSYIKINLWARSPVRKKRDFKKMKFKCSCLF